MSRFSILLSATAIAAASFAVVATAQDGPPRGEDRASVFFARFDANGDGAVTRAEVDAHHAARFAAADGNGDGVLSAEELTAASEGRRAQGVDRLISRADANGDGVLSAEELAGGPRGTMFERLDADGDGTITVAELERAGERGGERRGPGKRGAPGGGRP